MRACVCVCVCVTHTVTALYQCWTDVSSVTIEIMRKRRSVLIATSEAPLPSVMLYTNIHFHTCTYLAVLVHSK